MISYIDGKITLLTPTYVLLETSGIGYHINISLNTYSQLEGKERFKLLTVLLIKEDSHTLYGFASEEERSLFQHLISVNGVGAGIARLILSSVMPHDIRQAIIYDNERVFGQVKGIGPKTAKRIIIDLKDKLTKEPDSASTVMQGSTSNILRDESTAALQALGFQKVSIDKALSALMKDGKDYNLEQLIKAALRALSG
jgi:holliday junction DNA helicase RuvA